MSKYLEMRDALTDKILEFKKAKPHLEKKHKENEFLAEKSREEAAKEQRILRDRKYFLDVVTNFKKYIFEKLKKPAIYGALVIFILFIGFEGFSMFVENNMSLMMLLKSLGISVIGGAIGFSICSFVDSLDLIKIRNTYDKELLEALIKASEDKIKDLESVAKIYQNLAYKNLQAIDSINECIWAAEYFASCYEKQNRVAQAICRNDIEAVNECFEEEPINDEAYKLLRKSDFK